MSNKKSNEKRIFIGPAGWSYSDWEGVVYPEKGRKNFDQLAYLSNYFDSIEINSTFYRPPSPRVSRSWADRVSGNPDFLFSSKLFQNFTHKRNSLTQEDENNFKRGMEPLLGEGRLGALLVQFPYSFHNEKENREYLKVLFGKFKEYPLVLEVRHASWDRPFVYEFLGENSISFCNIDQPKVSYSLRNTSMVTGDIGYLRLHGRNKREWFRKNAGRDERYNYLYSENELKEISKAAMTISSNAKVTFVITNNHFRGQAICNAIQLKLMLTGKEVEIPENMLGHYPQLRTHSSLKNEKCKISPP